MTALPPLAVAALSTAALALLLAHRRANLGGRNAAGFVAAALAYGWIRSTAIARVSAAASAQTPYQIVSPLVSLFGVPLQELVGWTSATLISSYVADRLLRRLGRTTDAWSLALVAGCGMAAICLAVETAAVPAGWWSWSLGRSPAGWLGFPAIALVDWGFVALDFLLPFELWRRRAPVWQRIAGTLFFPVHLAGHVFTQPLGAWPISGFDLVHVGLVALAAAIALTSDQGDGVSPWPETGAERLRPAFVLGGGLVVATTAGQLMALGRWSEVWTGVPLTLALAAAAWRGGAVVRSLPRRLGPGGGVAVFLVLAGVGLGLRWPEARRSQRFEEQVARGVVALRAGERAAAREALTAALAMRPEHPDVLWLLGWIEIQSGEPGAARDHLEAAVAARPASVEATRYLSLLDLLEGRPAAVRSRLDQRRARYRETADLAYLAWRAARSTATEKPPPVESAPIVATASAAETREIYALARRLEDRATMQACIEREATVSSREAPRDP